MEGTTPGVVPATLLEDDDADDADDDDKEEEEDGVILQRFWTDNQPPGSCLKSPFLSAISPKIRVHNGVYN